MSWFSKPFEVLTVIKQLDSSSSSIEMLVIKTNLMKDFANSCSMEYYTIMTSFKYYPFVRRLTRVTDQSQNSTYHTWTNESHIVLKAVLVVYDLFDNF